MHLLTGKFSLAADCFSLFPRFFDGWLLESFTQAHFAENALALKFFLENAQCLIDVVIAY
ncbi:hypothetical protein AYO27_13300 [Rhizobium sp. GHKF11]|nr:hypothetical protein AYO27_13300 [Rhizobium sp. GHKF11]